MAPFTNLLHIAVVWLGVLSTIATTFADSYENIHNEMSADELRSIFHVDTHSLVPEYEVVHLQHKRSIEYYTVQNGEAASAPRSKVHNEKISTDQTYSNKRRKPELPRASLFDANATVSEAPKSLLSDMNVNTDATNAQDPNAEYITMTTSSSPPPVVTSEAPAEHIQLEAFGRTLNLKLRPAEGLIKKGGLKIFAVEPNVTAQHGVDYVEIEENEDEHVGDIYQDELNEAAILLRPDDETGSFLVEGSIGKDLVIRPLPRHLRRRKQDLSDDEMFLNQDDLNSEVSIDTGLPIKRRTRRSPGPASPHSVQLAEHVIYKRKLSDEDYFGDYAFMEPDHISKRYRRAAPRRTKREAPYVIYPEILVIVDYDGYRLHGGDNLQIKRYFVSFWNGVDLRYKLLKGPKIRISIAGIIISRGRDATPYLERNRVGRDAIDSAAALTDMGKYLFKERRLPVYDIAVAITKYDMCRRRKGGRCTKGTAGFAYVGGACVVNKRLEKVNSVAIIEDTGGFSGIIVAAHEVGHLLGAVHDGSPPPSYLGGPGAEKCRWEDGYIMSDLRHTERGFRWSPCSIQSFHHFLNGDTATCLYNSPHEDESLGRVLPGKLLTLDAQCRKDRGTSACFKDDRVCAQLFCFDSGSGYCVAYRPAAEGSQCGDGQYCLNGRCVAEHENIIPDYSQNTPSYIRRQDITAGNIAIGLQNTASTEVRPLYAFNSTTTHRYHYYPTTPAPATTTQYPYNYYQQYTPETTEHPYYLFYRTSTDSPYEHPTTTATTTTTTTTTENTYYNYYKTSTAHPYYANKYTTRPTTRSPYDFQNFSGRRPSTTARPKTYYQYATTRSPPPAANYYTTKSAAAAFNYYTPPATTKNPYVGDYYERISRTTKNPYDFANFGRNPATTTTAAARNGGYDFSGGNNYLKRSPNYYSASEQFDSRIHVNFTRPIVISR